MSDDDLVGQNAAPDGLHDAIEEALDRHAPMVMGAPALRTGYIVIAEWINPAGTRMLTSFQSDGMPSWQRQGMLHARLNDWRETA